MAYSMGNGIWGSVFAVPDAICDAHIKLASGLSVKALLLILRYGGRLELQALADFLGQSVCDTQDAVNYWVGQGILQPLEPVSSPEIQEEPRQVAGLLSYVEEAEFQKEGAVKQTARADPEEPQGRIRTISTHRPRLTTGEINELAEQDKNITYLLQETQTVLGKPLSPVASSTVSSLYCYSGMQPDLILMLVHYCASIGKSNMRYIERVADDWLEKGIDTHEKAEAEILRLAERGQIEGRVKRAFGIHDRNLITSEREYIRRWTDEYRLDFALVELAYERTIELKAKLSFPYINGILSQWHEKGIKTPAQALQELRSKSVPPSAQKQGKESSYDMGELEKMIAGGDM